MAQARITPKRLAISKANAQILAIVCGAAFVSIFCLVASRALFSSNQYNARVTTAKEKANTQLTNNTKAFQQLAHSYDDFNQKDPNAIGGSTLGTGPNDGNNSKIILDALPSTYDFPAVTSSLEKILDDLHLKISSITGTDDQVSQQANQTSANPEAVPIPFTFTVDGANYDSLHGLVTKLEHSTRPIQVDSITLSGASSNMSLTLAAHTYYQPGKNLDIGKKSIR